MKLNEDYIVCYSPYGLKLLKVLNANVTFTELTELRTQEFPEATDDSLKIEVSDSGEVVLIDWMRTPNNESRIDIGAFARLTAAL